MKGVVLIALKEMVQKNFGGDRLEEALRKAGINKEFSVLPTSDIDDQVFLKILNSVCEVLNLSLTQAAEAFGDYWINVYTQKVYGLFYKGAKTAKEFLLKMDSVHVTTTKSMPDAHPPRFEYE